MRVNEADPADRMMVITNRLYALAQEQESKGNTAVFYVLEDLYDDLRDVISDERHKDDDKPEPAKKDWSCENCINSSNCPVLKGCDQPYAVLSCGSFKEKEVSGPEPAGMTFMEAVKAMKGGKKVRRPGPRIDVWLCCSTNGTISIHHQPDSDLLPWKPIVADIEATDWKIVK